MKKVRIDGDSLYVILETIEDMRDNRGKKHKLIDIFILTLYGLLLGYRDFVTICYFLERYKKYFVGLLGLKHGIPSHDTFSRVIGQIDSADFLSVLLTSLERAKFESSDHIAIDGKAIRAARDTINKKQPPYIVSAFDCKKLVSLSQIKVGDKKNEITTIPELLKRIYIKDKTVTIDAIGCQKPIVDQIIAGKGNYLLSVKSNQKYLHKELISIFKRVKIDGLYVTHDKDHGRIEKRIHQTIVLDESSQKFFTRQGWNGIKMIGEIIRERSIGSEKSITKTYYITNKIMSNEEFGLTVREHWAIENNLHWTLDNYFMEDRSTARKDEAMENLSIFRKLVYNMMHTVGKERKKPKNQLFIDMNYDFTEIEKLLFDAIKIRPEMR